MSTPEITAEHATLYQEYFNLDQRKLAINIYRKVLAENKKEASSVQTATISKLKTKRSNAWDLYLDEGADQRDTIRGLNKKLKEITAERKVIFDEHNPDILLRTKMVNAIENVLKPKVAEQITGLQTPNAETEVDTDLIALVTKPSA